MSHTLSHRHRRLPERRSTLERLAGQRRLRPRPLPEKPAAEGRAWVTIAGSTRPSRAAANAYANRSRRSASLRLGWREALSGRGG